MNTPRTLPYLDTSGALALDGLKRYHRVANFRIGGAYDLDDPASYESGGEGGVTLESLGLPPVQIGYVTLGAPHRGEDGIIDNAVLVNPYYSGDSTSVLDFWGEMGARTSFSEGVHIGPGAFIDTDRHYVILVDALGLWGCSKPSASHPGCDDSQALGLRFPQYRLEDCVQLSYRLLRDALDVHRLELVTGVSLGASLTYVWAVMHPDFMKRILPIGGTPFQSRGMARWQFDLMTACIQSDPVYRETKGDYYHLSHLERPIRGNLFGWSLLRQSAYVNELRVEQTPEQYRLEAFAWDDCDDMIASGATLPGSGQSLFAVALIDSNDLIYRNRAQGLLDVEPELHRVKAKTLIIHVDTDQWLAPHIARRAHERIPGSQLHTFPHDMGHYGVFMAPARLAGEIKAFLER